MICRIVMLGAMLCCAVAFSKPLNTAHATSGYPAVLSGGIVWPPQPFWPKADTSVTTDSAGQKKSTAKKAATTAVVVKQAHITRWDLFLDMWR